MAAPILRSSCRTAAEAAAPGSELVASAPKAAAADHRNIDVSARELMRLFIAHRLAIRPIGGSVYCAVRYIEPMAVVLFVNTLEPDGEPGLIRLAGPVLRH